MVVIDRSLGFLGGVNIIDDNDVPKKASPRLDYAVSIEGPVVKDMYKTMHQLWRRLAWLHLRSKPKLIADKCFTSRADQKQSGVYAALVLRDNILHRRDIENAYISAIASAKEEVIIDN